MCFGGYDGVIADESGERSLIFKCSAVDDDCRGNYDYYRLDYLYRSLVDRPASDFIQAKQILHEDSSVREQDLKLNKSEV